MQESFTRVCVCAFVELLNRAWCNDCWLTTPATGSCYCACASRGDISLRSQGLSVGSLFLYFSLSFSHTLHRLTAIKRSSKLFFEPCPVICLATLMVPWNDPSSFSLLHWQIRNVSFLTPKLLRKAFGPEIPHTLSSSLPSPPLSYVRIYICSYLTQLSPAPVFHCHSFHSIPFHTIHYSAGRQIYKPFRLVH